MIGGLDKETADRILAFLASAGERTDEAKHGRARSLSPPLDPWDQRTETTRFLIQYFRDPRPGAGLAREIIEWTGRIPPRDSAIAVREITTAIYPLDGRDHAWDDLPPELQTRIIISVFNGMLRNA